MKHIISRAHTWYTKYERPISSFALIGGFVFNAVALKRVDFFWENFWIIEHLLVVAICIFWANKLENKKKVDQLHFWLIAIMQFTFGGLLSTFLVFYFRSAALSVTWPFLLILAVAFVMNERLKRHRSRLVFQIGLFYLSLYSFFIYIVPVILHLIGAGVFMLSSIISVLVMILYLGILQKFAYERFVVNRHLVSRTILAIFVVVNILYFLNFIPPIPFALKDGQVYHSLEKKDTGEYIVTTEEENWFARLFRVPTLHIVPGDPLYAYSAVFSPSNFQTDVFHEWQLYDVSAQSWVTQNRLPLPVFGGRDGGFRTYSVKNTVPPGQWRINVLTKNGQVIGRLRFNVEYVPQEPVLETITK